jgi:cytochrome P450 / NADPH-cytochrome P450 reductase
MEDPSYTLELKQTLTIKPDGFYFHATPRTGAPPLVIGTKAAASVSKNKGDIHGSAAATDEDEQKVPLYVLYGSNTGSSEAFAQRIASAASGKGESVEAQSLREC